MNMKKRNKIAGAIYGFAIGDAMGATTEFMTQERIVEKYGVVEDIIGGGWLSITPGNVTDDTQMSMGVMNAICNTIGFPYKKNLAITEDDLFKTNCQLEFIKWLNSKPIDVGNKCFNSIVLLKDNKEIPYDETALGNGSLMRALPCALINKEEWNLIQGKLTHNNDVCSRIISTYSRLIQNLIDEKEFEVKTKKLQSPTGHVVNTFNNALYWFNKNSFEEAIIGAVNHGGDADTIAAITGGLVGAKFGYDAIPERWIKQLNPNVKFFLENFKNFVFSYLQI